MLSNIFKSFVGIGAGAESLESLVHSAPAVIQNPQSTPAPLSTSPNVSPIKKHPSRLQFATLEELENAASLSDYSSSELSGIIMSPLEREQLAEYQRLITEENEDVVTSRRSRTGYHSPPLLSSDISVYKAIGAMREQGIGLQATQPPIFSTVIE